MRLTYIYHSGFAIEATNCIIIIDFFKDTEGIKTGIVYNNFLKSNKRIYALASHAHIDHFNRNILEWKNIHPDIKYILSKDILEAGAAKQGDAYFLDKLDIFSDEEVYIKAFGSTDIGVSFLIKCEGKTIFHAGDLNNWHWSEESTPEEINEAETSFLNEVNLIKKDTDYLDLAMFPVDKRLGKDYMRGAEQLIDNFKIKLFAPMHFSQGYEYANKFGGYAESKHTGFFKIKNKGDSVEF